MDVWCADSIRQVSPIPGADVRGVSPVSAQMWRRVVVPVPPARPTAAPPPPSCNCYTAFELRPVRTTASAASSPYPRGLTWCVLQMAPEGAHADGHRFACLEAFARALESHAAATLGGPCLLPVHQLHEAQRPAPVPSGAREGAMDGGFGRRSMRSPGADVAGLSTSRTCGPEQPSSCGGVVLGFDARHGEVVPAGSMLNLAAVAEACLQRSVRTATLLLAADLVLPLPRQTNDGRKTGASTLTAADRSALASRLVAAS